MTSWEIQVGSVPSGGAAIAEGYEEADDRLGQAGRRRRRRTRLLVALLALLAAWVGVELGGPAALGDAATQADALVGAHDFADAIAVYADVATRSGPAYLFAGSQIAAAKITGQQLYLQWAAWLAAQGRTDEALAACDRVTLAQLRDAARRQRAAIALAAAEAAARSGAWDHAVARLDQVLAGHPPADLAARATSLRPRYGLEAGRAQVTTDPERAVADLDAVVVVAPSGPEAAAAAALLPEALLAAGRQALAGHDSTTALAELERLVSQFPVSSQAATARALLGAPQPVTGTVVRPDGTPVAGVAVRLGSRFRRLGTGYASSPPYFFATTDGAGVFRFPRVPVGGPYVFEVQAPDGWTTIVATDGQPAYQVTVTPLTPVDLAFVVVPG